MAHFLSVTKECVSVSVPVPVTVPVPMFVNNYDCARAKSWSISGREHFFLRKHKRGIFPQRILLSFQVWQRFSGNFLDQLRRFVSTGALLSTKYHIPCLLSVADLFMHDCTRVLSRFIRGLWCKQSGKAHIHPSVCIKNKQQPGSVLCFVESLHFTHWHKSAKWDSLKRFKGTANRTNWFQVVNDMSLGCVACIFGNSIFKGLFLLMSLFPFLCRPQSGWTINLKGRCLVERYESPGQIEMF